MSNQNTARPYPAAAAPSPKAPAGEGAARVRQLAALLGFGVILWFCVLRLLGFVSSGPPSLSHLIGDALLTFFLALAAVEIAGRLARRWGIAEQSASGLFAHAALIVGTYSLLRLSAAAPNKPWTAPSAPSPLMRSIATRAVSRPRRPCLGGCKTHFSAVSSPCRCCSSAWRCWSAARTVERNRRLLDQRCRQPLPSQW